MIRALFLVVATTALTSCAVVPTGPIELNDASLAGPANRIAVYMTEIPSTNTKFPGAGCLLCIGVANAAHTSMTRHVQSLQPEGLDTIPEKMIETLNAKGATAFRHQSKIDVDDLEDFTGEGSGKTAPTKDFRPLAKTLNADKLLLLNISSQGVLRGYAAYVPTDVPKAYVEGAGYMVDLKTNQYLWYWPVAFYQAAEGAWDEPPAFPGLTNAYYQVLIIAAEVIAATLTAKAPPPQK